MTKTEFWNSEREGSRRGAGAAVGLAPRRFASRTGPTLPARAAGCSSPAPGSLSLSLSLSGYTVLSTLTECHSVYYTVLSTGICHRD